MFGYQKSNGEDYMRKFYIIVSIAILCFGTVLMSGCAQTGTVPVTPEPTTTAAPTVASAAPTVQVPVTSTPITTGNVYNESSNGTTVSVPTNGTFVVMLQENPTTGYVWNVTVTNGLTIVNNTFMPPTSGLMGAGGVHTWSVQAIQTGAQQFNGIYKRPFENLTGNETTFVLTVNVT
jgi:inhibitor of cysteine peptidase